MLTYGLEGEKGCKGIGAVPGGGFSWFLYMESLNAMGVSRGTDNRRPYHPFPSRVYLVSECRWHLCRVQTGEIETYGQGQSSPKKKERGFPEQNGTKKYEISLKGSRK